MPERNGRPIFLIDIAVPRDVDPAVREVAGCTLVNIDGLEEVTHHNLHERQKAMEAADHILDEEIELFRARQEQLNVVPTIVCLRRRVEEIRQAEMKRMRRMFGELTPEQEQRAGSPDAGTGEQDSPHALHRTEAGGRAA